MKVTAILISQKRSGHQADTPEAAGGLAVAHILDGTIIFNKIIIASPSVARTYHMPLGSVLRTLRIDGCRMAAHDSDEHVFEITEEGLIEIKERLSEFIAKREEKD
jgi:KaiC/GvpD/RAD55 family RecA-like ATPase